VPSTDLRILTVENLRGSMATFTLRFRADFKLTVIYGENGSGKTTICDALDFLGDGTVGSLAGRGLGNRVDKYWPSVGKVAHDVKVSLETSSGTLHATVRDGVVTVAPEGARPKVAVLRRPQIVRLVDARPADKYAEISRFVDVSPIEDAEAALKELIDELEGTRDRDIAVIVENQGEIARFWEAAGSPPPDQMTWAEAQLGRPSDVADAIILALSEVERTYVALRGDFGRLANSRGVVDTAREESTTAEQAAAAVKERQVSDEPDSLGILEAAATFLSEGAHDASTCPLCRSSDRAVGLLETVRARIDSLREVREAEARLHAAALKLHDATVGMEASVAEYGRHRGDFAIALGHYTELDGVDKTVELPPDDPLDLAKWVESTSSASVVWTAERDRIRNDTQFAETLRATVENYNTHIEEQKALDALLPRLKDAHTAVRSERQTFTDNLLASVARRVGELYDQSPSRRRGSGPHDAANADETGFARTRLDLRRRTRATSASLFQSVAFRHAGNLRVSGPDGIGRTQENHLGLG
jgi:hypothetical protein